MLSYPEQTRSIQSIKDPDGQIRTQIFDYDQDELGLSLTVEIEATARDALVIVQSPLLSNLLQL